jgi:hypothetical protein
MASRRRSSKSSTPLDERQHKLLQEQEKLQQQVAQLNKVIEEAPRIKAERARAQREALIKDRSNRGDFRLNSATLVDRQFDEFRTRPRKPLKAERRQTLLMFCGLVVLLAVLVMWLLSVWHGQWAG